MSKFQELVNQLPSDQRNIQGASGKWNLPLDYCFFGVPQSDFFGWSELNDIPSNCLGFHFYLGGTPVELISEFSQSKYPAQIEKLVIGDSSYAAGSSLDYSDLVKAIQNVEFPKLKELHLGIWELFCNAHCMFGKIGNVTNLLQHSPMIEKLGLYGQFELSSPLNFSNLKELTIELEDYTTGSNGGFITNKTLANLLNSNFPSIEKIFIDLNCEDDDYGYRFPEDFLSGDNFPLLRKIEITGGFSKGEKERLQSSEIFKKESVNFLLEDMLDS